MGCHLFFPCASCQTQIEQFYYIVCISPLAAAAWSKDLSEEPHKNMSGQGGWVDPGARSPLPQRPSLSLAVDPMRCCILKSLTHAARKEASWPSLYSLVFPCLFSFLQVLPTNSSWLTASPAVWPSPPLFDPSPLCYTHPSAPDWSNPFALAYTYFYTFTITRTRATTPHVIWVNDNAHQPKTCAPTTE